MIIYNEQNNFFKQPTRFDNDVTIKGNLSASGVATSIDYLTVNKSTLLSGPVSGNNIRVSFNAGVATGDYSFAAGEDTQAVGEGSHAEGYRTVAFGLNSHSENFYSYAGNYSHTEGNGTVAGLKKAECFDYTASTSLFTFTSATSGILSNVIAGDKLIVAESTSNTVNYIIDVASRDALTGSISATQDVIGFDSSYVTLFYGGYVGAGEDHAEGYFTIANGTRSHAEGSGTIASGTASHAEGQNTTAADAGCHAEGIGTVAYYGASHAEGQNTTASNLASHAEGIGTTASNVAGHAEGYGSKAYGFVSHAEGYQTHAIGPYSHTEGAYTSASGFVSHAEGNTTHALGNGSHASGFKTVAAQNYTYIWSDGELNTKTENISTTKTGQYMVSASGGVFIPGSVGIGTDDTSNALLTVNGTLVSLIPLENTTSTSYLLSTTDTSRLVVINNGVQSYVCIPDDSTLDLPAGYQVNITGIGSGVVTVSAYPGVYLRSADDRVNLRVANSTATVVKLSANDWLLFGDIN
jgi:hypothetical protein